MYEVNTKIPANPSINNNGNNKLYPEAKVHIKFELLIKNNNN